MKNENQIQLDHMRHTSSHLLAAAVIKLYPNTKPTIGPAIENGFYYDFEFVHPIAEEELPMIEKEMAKLLPSWTDFSHREVSAQEAKELFKHNPYKQELIDEIEEKGEKITLYKSGEFEDLCRGGHSDDPSKEIGAFKLLSVAGAYWRGTEKNKMLTRIYGTAFHTQKELDEYLLMVEEAKKRDHRKLGKQLDLFSFHEEGPGFVFWHPNGMLLREALMNVYNELHKKAGYQLVSTPMILSEDLWHKSGHWDHYKDNMYFTKIDGRTFAIKPMNCPGTSLIYKNRPRSYRDLPLRFAEQGEVHRHEPSGTLLGLFRVRAFRQDDAHLFVLDSQIEKEVKNIIILTLDFYKKIGFSNVHIELSTRPENSIGGGEIWTKAEEVLKKILGNLKLEYKLNEGDGAFYGPKIDFHIEDVLGRSWQCGTIQLDFFMPDRFDLTYIDRDGLAKRPVMIHRTVLGSIQRFVGILIEHFGGAFPLWLSPVQILLLPIADRHAQKSQEMASALRVAGIRVEVDIRQETLQAKIRDGSLQKVPYIGIIGDKEIAEGDGSVSLRNRDGKNEGVLSISQLKDKIKEEIDKKA